MQLLEQFRDILFNSGEWSWFSIAVISLFVATLIKISLRVFSSNLRHIARRTKSNWGEIGCDIIDGLKSYVLFAWSFYLLSKSMPHSPGAQKVFLTCVVALTSFQAGLWGIHIIQNWRNAVIRRKVAKDPSAAAALGLMYASLQIAFIVVIVLIGLSNVGIDIAALITGLGVGGIAVALAAQNILGDLLASLSIVIDKPFVVGDFIVVGNEMGTVEQIGLKTTRIRSLGGEELIFSNKDVLESRIRNYKRMWERRVVHKFGVVHSTPSEVLEKIPLWVKGFVEQHRLLRFERCHFSQFNHSSLDFELVFWVLDPDYNLYMDIQEKLLLDIHRKFSAEKVKFAYPTQTLYIENFPEARPPMKSNFHRSEDLQTI